MHCIRTYEDDYFGWFLFYVGMFIWGEVPSGSPWAGLGGHSGPTQRSSPLINMEGAGLPVQVRPPNTTPMEVAVG